MGDLIGISVALGALNMVTVAYLASLFKATTKIAKYGIAALSSAVTVFGVKFLGPSLLLLMEALGEDVPMVELPDIAGLSYPELGGVTIFLAIISGGGWNLLKSFGLRKPAQG